MKIKLLIMAMTVLLFSSAAQAAIISYQISGAIGGNNFSGQFTVSALSDSILLGSVGYGGPNAPRSFSINSFANLPGGVSWGSSGADFFYIGSAALDASLNNGSTWQDLINLGPGGFAITSADFYDFTGFAWDSAIGGTISFASGAVATPEPGTMLLLGSGIFTFGLSRFRRRKEAAL